MFQYPTSEDAIIVDGTYSTAIVLLSIVIAFGASFTALYINKQIQKNTFFHQVIWLVLASLAMGLGIWSMHFIGMMAFNLPVPMVHNNWLTILSMFPAVIASFVAFYLANKKKNSLTTLISASLLMGAGISSMHYLGMASMKLDLILIYKPLQFIVSILIAIVASFAAIKIFSSTRRVMESVFSRYIAAALLTIAISSMHYMGMFAAVFYTMDANLLHNAHLLHDTDFKPTILFIALGIFGLFLLTYLTGRFDEYVDYRIQNIDPLTKLPNQNQFTLDEKSIKASTYLGIIHIHNFEKYISAYSYAFGNEIILKVNEIIQNVMPEEVNVYRTEANRFTVVLKDEHNSQRLSIALKQVCAILEKPLYVDGRSINIEMVCAVSKNETELSIHQLFSNAIAVIQAPTTTFEHQIVEYDSKVHTFNFDRQLTVDVYEAMRENHLYLVYQPKVHPTKNEFKGLETLIRWEHPEYGFISPAQFIPILENANKINDLTDWIVEQVCKQIEIWNYEGVDFKQISINIPGGYLTSPKLMYVIDQNLIKYNVPTDQIELEITETSVINDIHNAILAVRTYRNKGISVAMDDFGTGLSSLSYLKEIPISTIKIDKSFVDGIPDSLKDGAILIAILNLCSSLELNVVIEGVETEEQVHYLKNVKEVPSIQGYFYSKPLKVDEFVKWISKQEYILH